MDRFLRLAIPSMFGGILLALIYWLFSASSDPSNSDPIARFATGSIQNLDTSMSGDLAPQARFVDLGGNEVTLQDFQGQVLLVNFWATWCGPCEREMPSLAALQTAKKGESFKVIAISVDSEADQDYAKQRLNELTGGVLDYYAMLPEPAGWDIVYDSGASRGFPTTVLFTEDGVHAAMLEGEADWASYEAVSLINELLNR